MIPLLLSLALAADLGADDLLQLARTSGFSMSPDGAQLVFTESRWEYDPEATLDDNDDGGWSRTHAVRLLDVASGTPRTLSADDAIPYETARFSPDGKWIGYIRGWDELVFLPTAGGEPIPADLGDLYPGMWDWIGPTTLAFTTSPERSAEAKTERWKRGGARKFDQAGENNRLYTVEVLGQDAGEPVEITDGTENIVDWAYSPEAEAWLLVLSPTADPYTRLVDAQVVLLKDGQRTVLAEDPECTGPMAWSPDGKHAVINFCEDTISIPQVVLVHELATGSQTRLLDGEGATVTGVQWLDDRTVGVRVAQKTETRFLAVPAGGGAAKDLGWTGGVSWSDLQPGPKHTWLTTASRPDRPGAIVQFDKQGRESVLYDPNPQVAEWELAVPEVVGWTNSEGTELEGVLLRPPGADGPTPLLVLPHGGPDSVSDLGFDRWGQFFASHGYAVFHPNYRGGIGYGIAHYAANRGRMGEIEFMDIESGVDALIERKLVDRDQLFYGGWSWGGYLTAWTIGHTDRYKAAMAGAAVVDVVNQYVTSDINHGEIADWEYNGRPWKGLENFDRSDPSRSLAHVTTPTLVLHGDADTRVPFAQGLTLYRALSDLGVESEMWVYPGQNHGLGKATHNIHRLDVWLDWMEKHRPNP